MSWNYTVTAHRPSAVSHAVTAAFTGPDDLNLIVAKSTRLEVHAVDGSGEGLRPLLDVPLYGRVATLEVWRPHGAGHPDLIFLSTERYRFALLAYDAESGEIVTKAAGDVSDKTGRPCDCGQIAALDPQHRLLGLHMYDGLFKIIPALAGGTLRSEAFNVRMEELYLLDLCFLAGTPRPTLATLHEDSKHQRYLKTHEVSVRDKALSDGPWPQVAVEASASQLIALPFGGVLVLSEHSVACHSGGAVRAHQVSASGAPTLFRAHGRVDPDGTRWLLSDAAGTLYVLAIGLTDRAEVTSLTLERLGQTVAASAICYLDNGVVYLGSSCADAVLLSLSTEAHEDGSYFSELARWENLGPIVDFAVLDPEGQGQGQVVTCSGTRRDGSIRVVRSGVAFDERASLPLPGVKAMWSLHASGCGGGGGGSGGGVAPARLVLSFVSETRLLAMARDEEEGDHLAEVEEGGGFDTESATVFAASLAGGAAIVQATSRCLLLLDAASLAQLGVWSPPDGAAITLAAAHGTTLLLATAGRTVALLRCDPAAGEPIALLATRAFEHEVACLALRPPAAAPSPPDASLDASDADVPMETDSGGACGGEPLLAAVGSWTSFSLSLLSLPSLAPCGTTPLGDKGVVPRSLAFYAPAAAPHEYLLCGLGDGKLLYFPLPTAEDAAPVLGAPKAVPLATQPLSLVAYTADDGEPLVFCCSERPALVHASAGQLLFSSVNLPAAHALAPFSCDALPGCLAAADEESLLLGNVLSPARRSGGGSYRRPQVSTYRLGEQPRRIAPLPTRRALALLTSTGERAVPGGEETERYKLRVFDDSSFAELASAHLLPDEAGLSILVSGLGEEEAAEGAAGSSVGGLGGGGGGGYIVVGTAHILPDEPEPTSGRILVFELQEGSLELRHEAAVRGAVYSLAELSSGLLLAGVNNKLQLFEWEAGAPRLALRAEHCGHILVLYVQARADFILVGDLMKSITLLQWSAGELTELARDVNANWMTAVAFLDDDTFLGAENALNLFAARKRADAPTEEERGRLEVVCEFHLGEFVNRFRRGSLTMQMREAGAEPLPTMLYGSVNGVVGVVASLPQELYVRLAKVQTALSRVVKGVGGLSHASWRSFVNDRKTADAHGFIDGDLIEAFLDLPPRKKEEVVAGLDMTAEQLSRVIEQLARLH